MAAVKEAWNIFLDRRLKNTRDVLSSLSKGQLKILTYIALDHHKELTGQNAQRALGLAGSSVTRFIKVLEELDYVEVSDNKTYIIDPLIRDILKQFEPSILAR